VAPGLGLPLPRHVCTRPVLSLQVFKQPVVAGEATPTQVAQAICGVVLPGSPRCAGTLPVWNATGTRAQAGY
jgi:hypothetical protein